jgi:alkanesulfonate monooxygenase SsuD/methylene tetrahydromethanopterin reductase-like flavin-dependent oxidoreductase (luciferase family)
VDGDHYQVHGYHPGPRPAHAIEVWVGAYRPRMLRTIGRVADGWLPSLGRIPLDELASMQGVIDASARAVGRDPAAIRRMLNLSGSVGRPAGTAEGMTGTADAWVETLVEWATGIGVDTFILWPSLPERSQVKTWATEVVPRVRAEVDRRRSGGGAG